MDTKDIFADKKLRLRLALERDLIPDLGKGSDPYLKLMFYEVIWRIMGAEHIDKFMSSVSFVMADSGDSSYKILEFYYNLSGLRMKRYRK